MIGEEEHLNFIKKIEQTRKDAEQRRAEIAKLEQKHRVEEQSKQKSELYKFEEEKKNKKKQ